MRPAQRSELARDWNSRFDAKWRDDTFARAIIITKFPRNAVMDVTILNAERDAFWWDSFIPWLQNITETVVLFPQSAILDIFVRRPSRMDLSERETLLTTKLASVWGLPYLRAVENNPFLLFLDILYSTFHLIKFKNIKEAEYVLRDLYRYISCH